MLQWHFIVVISLLFISYKQFIHFSYHTSIEFYQLYTTSLYRSQVQTFNITKLEGCIVILGKKSSVKLDFKLGMELKKVQKQGRDERTQEDYPTSAKIHTRSRVVFLSSCVLSSLPCFCTFFSSIPNLKSSFTETFFP